MICKKFPPFCGLSFHFIAPVKTGSSEAQKFLILMMSSLSFFFFACAFDVTSKKSLPIPSSQRFTPKYSKKFGSLLLTFETYTHFELSFVYGQSTGLPRWLSGEESACQCRRLRFDPEVGKIPWTRKWQPTPVFLPGKSHGQGSLADYSPWDCKKLHMT